MSGKKRQMDPDPDSEPNLAAEYESPMDSDSPAVDPRPSVTSTPGDQPTPAPGNDPRLFTSDTRTLPSHEFDDRRSSLWDDGPYL